MANPAPNLAPPGVADRQEFWKPMIATQSGVEVSEPASTILCPRCRGELLADSRLCPHCGAERGLSVVENAQSSTWVWQLVSSWRNASVRDITSALALVAGGACIVAAALTSLVFKATNLVDWQAVQLWRIEWLLAAIAILLVGVLLKKK